MLRGSSSTARIAAAFAVSNPAPRVALLGPAPPDRGGIAHETARLAQELSRLTEVEVLAHRGAETTALATGEAAHCPDTLEEERWPEYAQAALAYGVRCSVTLAHQPGPEAVTLSLFGARPRVLDPGQIPLAELLVAAGGALVDNLSQFGDARRAALQFRDAAQSRLSSPAHQAAKVPAVYRYRKD